MLAAGCVYIVCLMFRRFGLEVIASRIVFTITRYLETNINKQNCKVFDWCKRKIYSKFVPTFRIHQK